jgi:hypothetical protein
MRSRVGAGSPPRATRDATCHWVGAPFESHLYREKPTRSAAKGPQPEAENLFSASVVILRDSPLPVGRFGNRYSSKTSFTPVFF